MPLYLHIALLKSRIIQSELGKIPFYKIAELKESRDGDREFEVYRLDTFMRDIDHLKLPHRHDHFAIYFITAGEGAHSLDFCEYALNCGRLFFSYAGQVHAWAANKDVNGYVALFEAAYFNRNDQAKRLRDFIFFNTRQLQPFIDLDTQGLNRFLQLFSDIEKEHIRADRDPAIIQAYLAILLHELRRCFGASLNTISIPHSIVNKVQEFETMLDQLFKIQKNVNAYAESLNITPNYLNTICKKVKGKLASELIHQRLILEAKRFLTHTTQNVAEIAYDLGFEDNSYFGRFFKKRCGMTPVDFRRIIQAV